MKFVVQGRLRLAAVSFVLALLSACGGGGSAGESGSGGGGSPQPTIGASDYFPSPTGAIWIYTTNISAQPDVVRVTGTQTIEGRTGPMFETTYGDDGSVRRDLYVVDSSGIRQFSQQLYDSFDQALNGLLTLPASLTTGTTVQQLDKTVDLGEDFDGDGRKDSARVVSVLTVIGPESIQSPAGDFSQALHMRQAITMTVSSSAGLGPVVINFQMDRWYALGVGLVSSSMRAWAPGYDQTSKSQLSAYRVGSRSSDTTAPVISSVLPAENATITASGTVQVNLSEAIDPASVTNATLMVTDADKVRIPGTVGVSGSTLTFTAGGSWASGTYTAHLATGVKDLLGNPLAATKDWTFTVDSTAPGVVTMSPAAGSQNVDITTAAVLTFTENVDPKSVNANQVRLTSAGINVDVTTTVSGKTITLTPKQQLLPGKTYDVYAWGVTDLAGNAMTGAYSAQFQTSQGRFAYPVALPGLPVGLNPPSAMAIGDVNGDGINDVLGATWGALNGSLDGLYMFAGRADGSLAAGVKLDIGSMAQCSITSIALGDVNRDGRVDVIVAGNYCGVQVLHQAADGSLQKGEYLTTATSAVVRVVDLDGNGYNALVGVGGGSGNITIWRQDGNGTLQPSETVPVSNTGGYARDIAVADINGDGRPDLIAAVNGFSGQDVALVLRNADGSFGTTQYLSVGSVWGASAIAVGDFNGDGRTDIVATTGGNSPTSITVFYQAAGGLMGPATPVSTYDSPMAVASADIDGDGRTDIVVSHVGWGAVGVYRQQPSGLLDAEKRYSAPYGNFLPGQMAVGDFNHDGLPDIAIAGSLIMQQPAVSTNTTSTTTRTTGARAKPQSRSASLAAIGKSLMRKTVLGAASR
ncbi:FG-GAP-like repeat-containing protein [Roseateles sp.]|uniref:FG-GAP-like repeat-containing protein n=1 Tax=Roseateles sp. TaxID=1971397 RepID=UPI0032674852